MSFLDGLTNSIYGVRLELNGKYFYVRERGDVSVLELGNRFFSSGMVHSGVNRKGLLTNSYWDFFLPLPAVYESPKVLVIGQAGGSIPYMLAKRYGEKISIDVVEIDRELVDLPKVFLGLEELPWKTHIGDAAAFVKDTPKRYDIIISDAYVGLTMPRKFIKEEFMNDAWHALSENGMLATNIVSLSYLDPCARSMGKRFQDVYCFKSLWKNNFVIGAKDVPLERIRTHAEAYSGERESGFLLEAYRNMGSTKQR